VLYTLLILGMLNIFDTGSRCISKTNNKVPRGSLICH